jgi:hypothetical protein
MVKGKSKFLNSFNESRSYLNYGILISNNKNCIDATFSLRDFTQEDKNLSSLRFGLMKKMKINFDKNNVDIKNNLSYLKSSSNDLNNFFFGFIIDRSLYPKNDSNSNSHISSRNYLKFLFGLEKENFSALYKLKYNNFNRHEVFHRGYIKYLTNNNTDLKVNFSYSAKNNKFIYCISSAIKIDPNTKIDILLDNNNSTKIYITSKLNNKLSINLSGNFLINETNTNNSDNSGNNNCNNNNISGMKFGLGLQYDFDNDLFPQINQNFNNYNTNEYYFTNNNTEEGINFNSIKDFFYNSYNNIRNMISSIDIY